MTVAQATAQRESGPLSPEQRRRGVRLVYLGQTVGPVVVLLITKSALGVLFVKKLGGSDLQAMLMGSMPLLLRVLQIPTSLLVPPAAGKRYMLRCWWVFGAALFGVVGVTFMPVPGPAQVTVILWVLLAGSAVFMSGSTFWFPLLHEVVPEDRRGRFFGQMRTIWSAASFLAILAIGAYLGPDPPVWKFRVVFTVGAGLFLARNVILVWLPEGRTPAANDDYSDWKAYVKWILSRREVVVFGTYYSLLGFAAGFLGTPLVLYMVAKGFPVCDNMIVFGFTTLGQVGSLLVAGHLTDRIGTKRTFAAAHVVLCGVSFAVVGIGWLPAVQTKLLFSAALVVAGAMIAMAGVACSAQIFHLAPDRGRAFFMSLSIIVMTTGAALSPIVVGVISGRLAAGWSLSIAGRSLDIFQVVTGCAGLTMLALMLLLVFVADVRPRSGAVPAAVRRRT